MKPVTCSAPARPAGGLPTGAAAVEGTSGGAGGVHAGARSARLAKAAPRHAFTMLEMLLAVALGSVLMLVCFGLMYTVDRVDRSLAVRHAQAEEMSVMHRVMDRTFSTMLMASEAQAAQEMQNRAGITGGEVLRPSRPRLLLEQDAAAAARGDLVQRLEVVLFRSPVPPGFGREMAATEVEHAMSGPVRGVFELRPDEDDGLAMWWRPLPRDEAEMDGYRFQLDPREDEYAVRLATGITEAKWLAFKNREREPMIEAKLPHDLPAQMELHVRMSSGYAAQWMFEVQWLNGPETAEELAEAQEAEALGLQQGQVPASQRNEGGQPGGRNVARPVHGSDGATKE